MARHNGIASLVKHDDNVLDGHTTFSVTEEAATHDTSAARDAWEDHTAGLKKWSGEMEMHADFDAAANQTLRAGDVIAFEGYSEGDGTGKTYYSGSATVTSVGIQVPFNDGVKRTYSIQGKGALSVATVS
ncbi:hypothetical protein N0B44_15585 [Roseibacterium beibuensis]|uniref:Uncharacterized protein n=1 Tax=[Roseibacterium] beibuensis TaxID=1193142 RepID=A0ABP9L951_9RHOB|nr:hypothetical protein [Roseibacterium beibuensis]MCS6624341.1 hypothetical protein [Roseibacterium beibuensis]